MGQIALINGRLFVFFCFGTLSETDGLSVIRLPIAAHPAPL